MPAPLESPSPSWARAILSPAQGLPGLVGTCPATPHSSYKEKSGDCSVAHLPGVCEAPAPPHTRRVRTPLSRSLSLPPLQKEQSTREKEETRRGGAALATACWSSSSSPGQRGTSVAPAWHQRGRPPASGRLCTPASSSGRQRLVRSRVWDCGAGRPHTSCASPPGTRGGTPATAGCSKRPALCHSALVSGPLPALRALASHLTTS